MAGKGETMCKIVVREIHGEPRAVPGNDWTRWEFTATASIDGGEPVKAIVKTFDEPVKERIINTCTSMKEKGTSALPVWKAETYDKGQTVSYTIKAADNPELIPPKRRGGGKGSPLARSNSQVALESAARVVSGMCISDIKGSDPAAYTLDMAERFKAFLEGGA